VNRDAQSILLVLIGAAITRITVDNTFLQYVRAGLRPWLLIAGVILIAVGLTALARENLPRLKSRHNTESDGHQESRQPESRRPESSHPEDSHPNNSHRQRIAWLLVVPVLAIFVVEPGALGAYSASRGGGGVGSAPPNSNGFTPLPAGSPVPDTIRDFSQRALWDHGRTLTGRHVTLTGFVTPRGHGQIYLTRLMITCCAADASPINIRIDGSVGAQPANSWLQITGNYAGIDHSQPNGEDPVPILRAVTVRPMKPPTNPYEN
jgi:putative membrane protein